MFSGEHLLSLETTCSISYCFLFKVLIVNLYKLKLDDFSTARLRYRSSECIISPNPITFVNIVLDGIIGN